MKFWIYAFAMSCGVPVVYAFNRRREPGILPAHDREGHLGKDVPRAVQRLRACAESGHEADREHLKYSVFRVKHVAEWLYEVGIR